MKRSMTNLTKQPLSPDAILVPAPEFVLILVEEGCILDGGRQTEMLSGPMALSSLPVILPLFNGHRSLVQVANALSQGANSGFEDLVEQLLSWGTLCSREELSSKFPQTMRDTLSFSRRGDSRASLDAASNVLTTTEIFVMCDEGSREFTHETAEALRLNGFCRVHAHVDPDVASIARSEDSFVISIVNTECSFSALKEHYTNVLSVGCRWLRVTLGNGSAEVGPVFTADSTFCLSC